MKNLISLVELKNRLSYDPETGILRWRQPPKCRPVLPGDVAGGLTDRGYIRIKLSGRNYLAHRLAWLYETGFWPGDEIDHINNVRDDNRIANLRVVDHQGNQLNRVNNRRVTCGGKTLTVSQWSEETGLVYATILSRLKRGWDHADAVSRPV